MFKLQLTSVSIVLPSSCAELMHITGCYIFNQQYHLGGGESRAICVKIILENYVIMFLAGVLLLELSSDQIYRK